MTNPLISYPGGSTVERTSVLALTRTPDGLLFAVARTPCHPESRRWPDQPADRCALRIGETATATATAIAIDCREGYLLRAGDRREPGANAHTDTGAGTSTGTGTGTLSLEPPEPESEAVACVVHRVPAESQLDLDTALTPGTEVTLSADEGYRERLSRSHSRCHLVTLALNHTLCDAWRKDPGRHDSLGNPDFDALAIVSSKIDERGSLDTYRIGKSLRKSGFPAEALGDTAALARVVARTATEWIASRPAITVTPGECALEERRTWSCELPPGTASFPCGGTHARSLSPEEGFVVELAWDPEAKQLTMDVRDI